jgi:exonuclease III
MKIVSYNLNGIRARLPRLLEYLEREQRSGEETGVAIG